MAENNGTKLGSQGSSLPVPRPLVETSANATKPNHSMLPAANGHLKRKIPGSGPNGLPEKKVPKSNIVPASLATLSRQGFAGSSIARPASAASSRHGSSKSIDTGLHKKATGIRPPPRSQPYGNRPATAMAEPQNAKDEVQADAVVNSMILFSSCAFPFDTPSSKASYPGGPTASSMDILSTDMMGLNIDPFVTLKRGTYPKDRRPLQESAQIPVHSRDLSPKKPQSPKKVPAKQRNDAGYYLTKESNTRVTSETAMAPSMMSEVEKVISTLSQTMALSETQHRMVSEAADMQRARVARLEESRAQLEDTNNALQQDLNAARASVSTTVLEADEQRRRYLDELDSIRRQHLNEVDDMRRKHIDELDILRRDSQKSRDEVAASTREECIHVQRQHETEIEKLRRELNFALEEEKQARKREVGDLREQAESAQKVAATGEEQHIRQLQDKDERVVQLSKQVERERSLNDDLRKQLGRSADQNGDLENSARNLRARVEFLESDSKSQSQAFADLEQQTQDAVRRADEYKQQLRKEETIRRKLLNQIQDLKGNIRVFCRVRPSLAFEEDSCASISFPDSDLDAKAIDVQGQEEKSSLGKVTTRTHSFSFDRVFGPSSQNSEIFEELSELVSAVCGGSFNTCIFSYGQTGSGKTYTMASPDGMISRAVRQIFSTAGDLVEKGWSYHITGSFVEVYNENINDLLGRAEEFDKIKHEIRHDPVTQSTVITDVMDVALDSAEHFGTVLDQALRNRSIAATKANERSSRSHSVCILKLKGENHITGETCQSTLNLVDLAGSERLAHSQATGSRLKETQNINKSLSCLADVIAALGDAKEGAHIPYRNSKLTYLLQNSLGGNSKTLMFVMMSPLQEHLSETLSSLNFATKLTRRKWSKNALLSRMTYPYPRDFFDTSCVRKFPLQHLSSVPNGLTTARGVDLDSRRSLKIDSTIQSLQEEVVRLSQLVEIRERTMSPSRDHPASTLPPSVESAYRLKCIQLRRRMQEVEAANDEYRLRKLRLARGIRKMRLERAILLETLSKRMSKKGQYDDETEDSTDSPPTPQERPMRLKRSHRKGEYTNLEASLSRPGGSSDANARENMDGSALEPYANAEDSTNKDDDVDMDRIDDVTSGVGADRRGGSTQPTDDDPSAQDRLADDGDEMAQD